MHIIQGSFGFSFYNTGLNNEIKVVAPSRYTHRTYMQIFQNENRIKQYIKLLIYRYHTKR